MPRLHSPASHGRLRWAASFFALLLFAAACPAHVGSPDVYFQGNAGPYHLMVMVRTPPMIPGVAQVQIHTDTPGLREIHATPLYIVGAGAKYPPSPDVLQPVPGDPQSFTGNLWMMDAGSWQVRLQATGTLGDGVLSVPVPAYARSTLPMQRWLGALLGGMMVLLVAALISIFGAARREAALPPGVEPGTAQRKGAWRAMAIASIAVLCALWIGNWWWNSVAARNTARKIYQPPQLGVSLAGNSLTMRIADSEWHTRRPDTVMTGIIPDHGHLMHLFLIRTPQLDRLYHLHPRQDANDPSVFIEDLPSVDAGHYKIFADIVRTSGFPDTMIAETDIPAANPSAQTTNDAANAAPGDADDSEVSAPPLTSQSANNPVSPLPDGARMVWERDPGPLTPNRLIFFRFRVEDSAGHPVTDLEPYMGMAAHAEFIASDFSVFAHVHPDGSVSMAALDLAAAPPNSGGETGGMAAPAQVSQNGSAMQPMAMQEMDDANTAPLPAEVSFPYGFPKAGLYRIFVQVKRKGRVATGVFDATVN